MRENWRLFLGILWALLGAVLFGLGVAEVVDSYWSGMGGALMAVGLLRVIQHIRYRKNTAYREKVETEGRDERNKFISNKAWAWAGYCFVLVESVLVIAFKLMGREELMMMAAWNVCGIMLLYWVFWYVFRRKY